MSSYLAITCRLSDLISSLHCHRAEIRDLQFCSRPEARGVSKWIEAGCGRKSGFGHRPPGFENASSEAACGLVVLKSCLPLGRWRCGRGSRPKNRLSFKELIAHPAVEALDITVLHGLARRDVVPFDAMILRPGEDGVRGELRAVVGDDHARLAASGDQIRQLTSNAPTGYRRVRDRGQAFARHVVDDVEHSEASAAGELVVHEVQRPARVRFASTRIGALVPTARRRARRLRTVRPSSR